MSQPKKRPSAATETATAAPAGMEDAEIVELYWQRNEKAIYETDVKYRKRLFSMAYSILHDRGDCEECLNDTYLRTWNSIPPTRPAVFPAFITTILRRIAIDRYKQRTSRKWIPSELTVSLDELEFLLPDGDTPESEADAAMLGRLISAYVRGLSERERYVFMGRYYAAETIERIAAGLVPAVCLIPIAKLVFGGAGDGNPVFVQYETFDGMKAVVGEGLLFDRLDDARAEDVFLQLDYHRGEDGGSPAGAPWALHVRQTYRQDGVTDRVHLYIFFDRDSIDSPIGGYEEQGLTKTVNGITVRYSHIEDPHKHSRARFLYGGHLYILDVDSSGEEWRLDGYLERLTGA